MTVLLVSVAVAFAWSMGAHYTGACMGMPRALRALSPWQALVLMAPLTLLGATIASHAVERTVADRLTGQPLSAGAEVVVLAVAFSLTTMYNRLRVPTSTIQVLVFSLAGTALGVGDAVRWPTVGELGVVWVAVPFVAGGLGFGLTRVLDRVRALRPEPAVPASDARGPRARVADRGPLGVLLVLVGAAASFAMGSNDVANATGSLLATHTFSPLVAGAVGGGGLALGVLTWGRPLLERIAFDIVDLDHPMAAAAQGVQAVVVLLAAGFGFFTSMNQALVGAMAGAGAARGRQTVHRATLVGIVRGWLLGPAAGIALGFAVSRLAMVAGASLH